MKVIPQKIRILKFICEQGVVTVDNINDGLFKDDKSAIIRVTLHQLKIAHVKFGNIKHGIWFIDKPELFELLKTFFPNLPTFEVKPVLLYQVPHNLEINRIRIVLQNNSHIAIDQWWSERFIRALPSPLGGRIATTKIPDAIFWRRRTDGTNQKFFLEYERTLKNKIRYVDILKSYAKREDVTHKNVLYICENTFIKEELEHIEKKLVKEGELSGIGLYFQFLTLESFYKTYKTNQKEESKNDSNTTNPEFTHV